MDKKRNTDVREQLGVTYIPYKIKEARLRGMATFKEEPKTAPSHHQNQMYPICDPEVDYAKGGWIAPRQTCPSLVCQRKTSKTEQNGELQSEKRTKCQGDDDDLEHCFKFANAQLKALFNDIDKLT